MTETITDIAELERRIRVVKIAVMKRARETGTDQIPWSDPAYPDYCRRGRALVAEMQAQVEKLKADKVVAMTRTAQPIVVDAPRGATIEARPLPNGWWRAIAGYTYAGLSGLHAVDAGIGDKAFAHEALLIALAKVREGAVDVIEKRFWSDVPATLTKQAEEILAFCDFRTRLVMEHPSTVPAKDRKKAGRKKAAEAEAPIAATPMEPPVPDEAFHAHLDLGRTLGAGIHLRRLDDSWQVRHDCSWGNGGYSIKHHGRFPTQRAAYDHAVMRIRKTAQWAIEAGDSVRLMARIGEPDVRRAKQILAWLDGLVPPGPDEVTETVIDPAPLAPPKRIYLGAPASPIATIAVAPNEDGRWSQASVVHLGIHGYDDFALDVGPTFATEEEAWETAIRRVHVFLAGIKKTSGKTLEYARGWIDGVARERGIDLRAAA